MKQQQLFHGTGVEGLEGIPKHGFRVPEWSDGNMFGRGIYFAPDSSKSAQARYTKGSKALILCDVLLGEVCEVPGLLAQHALSKYVKISQKGSPFLDVDENKIRKEGFDSVYAPRDTIANAGVLYDEMIIYNPSQAMPRYVIHFGQVRSWQNDPTYLPGKALETAAQIKAALDAALAPLVTPANYITQFVEGSLESADNGSIASDDACHGPECEKRAVCDAATAGCVRRHPAPIAVEPTETALSSAGTPIAQDAPQDAPEDAPTRAADGHQHSKQSADVSLYHATSLEAALRIQAEGFRMPKGPSRELLGPGVYASATLQKALQYCGGPEGGIVFELAVDLGRCKILEENDPMMTTWQQHGYDSAYARTGAGGLSALAGIWRTLLGGAGLEEHCIKDPRRIAIKQAIAGHTSQLQQAGYTIVGGEIVKVR